VKRLAVGAPSEPNLNFQAVSAHPERKLSITPEIRLSVLQQLCQIEVTEDEIVLLMQILERANLPIPQAVESHRISRQITSSTTDVISESEPILEPDRSPLERPENAPPQRTTSFTNPTSESEGADLESVPAPGAQKPHRKLTLPPAQRESRESQRAHCDFPFTVANLKDSRRAQRTASYDQVYTPSSATSPMMSQRQGSSVRSDMRSDQFSWGYNQSSNHVEFLARYTACQVSELLPANHGSRHSRTSIAIVASCVSGSGDTIAIIEEYEYRVYRSFVGRTASVKPKCVGRFDPNGGYRAGIDVLQARSHGHITIDKRKRNFLCAAISDNLLAMGASKGSFFLFSIGEGEQALGRAIFKSEQPDRIIQKILFNSESTELAVLSSIQATNTEICQFYAVGQFPIITSQRGKTSSFEYKPGFSADCEISIELSYPVERGVYPYNLRDAKFSSDGRKLIGVTNHINGSAMIFMAFRDEEDQWTYGGSQQIVVHRLDNWDDDCLGYTGISL
jgi:hypothetical protein